MIVLTTESLVIIINIPKEYTETHYLPVNTSEALIGLFLCGFLIKHAL